MTLFLLTAAGLCLFTALWLTGAAWWPRRAAANGTEATTADAALVVAPSRSLAVVLAMFLFVIAGIGYARLGAPQKLALGPESSAAAASAAAAAAAAEQPKVTAEQVNEMVGRLAEHLKEKPDDLEGWTMLGRSYVALGRYAEGADAYRNVAKQRTGDVNALLELANAVAMANDRSLDGEPMKLINQALKIDPENPKALTLAGTAAYIQKDYKTAVAHWERLLKSEAADSELAQRVQATVTKARQLGGMSPVTLAAGSAPSQARASAPAAAAARVSGTVTLAAALKGKASPDDTVFIFARPSEGARMPLAILRKQVKDLPVQFMLDDSMAMSPAAKLSDHKKVSVGARVSKSGNAMPQSGDLQGMTTVAVGADGVQIDISEVLAR